MARCDHNVESFVCDVVVRKRATTRCAPALAPHQLRALFCLHFTIWIVLPVCRCKARATGASVWPTTDTLVTLPCVPVFRPCCSRLLLSCIFRMLYCFIVCFMRADVLPVCRCKARATGASIWPYADALVTLPCVPVFRPCCSRLLLSCVFHIAILFHCVFYAC